jgi:hypothetical protein
MVIWPYELESTLPRPAGHQAPAPAAHMARRSCRTPRRPALQPLLQEDVHHEIRHCDTITKVPRRNFLRSFVFGRCRGELCMQLPTLFLDNLLHDTKPSKRDPPHTHTEAICGRRCCRADQHYPSHRHPCRRRRPRRRFNRVGRRAPREQRLYHVCVAHGRGVQQGSASEEAVVICLHSACGCSVTARDTDSPMLAGVAGFASCGAEHARAISAYRHGRACKHAARVHAKLSMVECPDGSLEIWPVTDSAVT